MSGQLILTSFSVLVFPEQRCSAAGMHRHAQEQLTCSQRFTVLPSLSDPTKQKWKPVVPVALPGHESKRPSLLLSMGPPPLKKPARDLGVSQKQNVEMSKKLGPQAVFLFLFLFNAHWQCIFLWFSLKTKAPTAFFSLELSINLFSFNLTLHYIMHAPDHLPPVFFSLCLFFSEPPRHFHFQWHHWKDLLHVLRQA